MKPYLSIALLGILFGVNVSAQERQRKGGSRQPVQMSKCNDIPAHPYDIILGRPTKESITVSVMAGGDDEGFISYGVESGKPAAESPKLLFKKGEPHEVSLTGLKPDTRYFYQLHLGAVVSPEFTFHTARPSDAGFTFTITADSHLDEHTDPAIYQKTLANALADKPDFNIDLGDTFMSEKQPDRAAAAKQYISQRYYFGQLGKSTPLFLVLGNHDGESPRRPGDASESLAVWSNGMRNRYFPNPVPDGFYTGNVTKHPQAGLLEDYYAWQWGDALCVVLDPFWFSQKGRGNSDNWNRTLGTEQYQWLKRTLEGSKAKYKFIFIHHLVGGTDGQCRGGAEAAPLYEWGGKNADGSDGFQKNRPDWAAPIHQLLKDNHVSVVFHGHDHFYAKQELDGIIYQESPQPGYAGNGKAPRSAAEYGYASGTILGSSGHLRVIVSPEGTKVDYVRTGGVGDSKPGEVADSYLIKPMAD